MITESCKNGKTAIKNEIVPSIKPNINCTYPKITKKYIIIETIIIK
jgi:hypothetical protein